MAGAGECPPRARVLPLPRGKNAPDRSAGSAGRYPTPDDLALVSTRRKLGLIDPDAPGPQPTTRQLYDLASDPGEASPLDPDALPAERDRLLAFLASLPPRL